MQIAILLFDRFTALDAVGPYQVLSRLPGADVVFAAEQPGLVTDDSGALSLSAPAALADVPHPDILVVPGGPGQNDQMKAGPLHEWLRAADQGSTWTTSVCTGSLILAAAGVSAGLDMGLALAGWIAGDQIAQSIQLGIEYDPQPPYDAGSPDRAPAEVVASLRSRSRFILNGRTAS